MRQRQYWCTVGGEWPGHFEHACRILRNLGRTLGLHKHVETPHRNDRPRRTPQKLWPVTRWPNSTRTRKGGNRGNALHKQYRACTVRMCTSDHICHAEGRFATILYLLQMAKRGNSQGWIPNPANGRVFRLAGTRAHILKVGRPLWVMSGQDWRLVQGKTTFTSHLWLYRFFDKAVSSEERPEYVPARRWAIYFQRPRSSLCL